MRLLPMLATLWLLVSHAAHAVVPALQVQPDSLDLGNAVVTRTSTAELLLLNQSGLLASITRLRIDGYGADRYLIDRHPFTLDPGEERPMRIQLLPESIGEFEATLVFEGNFPTVEVPLTGYGVTPDPATHNTVMTNVLLNGTPRIANFAPGTAVTLGFDYHTWSRTGCPSCIIYIVAGVEEDAQGTRRIGIPGRYPGRSGSTTIEIYAPSSPGVYFVYGFHAPDVSSGAAISRYESQYPSDAHMPVALMAVVDPEAPPPPTGVRTFKYQTTVSVTWDSARSTSIEEYYIYRGVLPNAVCLIDSVEAPARSYIDTDVRADVDCCYRLRARDAGLRVSGFSDDAIVVGVGEEQRDSLDGQSTGLRICPNPFNPGTTIEYELTRACYVSLEMYDIRGYRVATLVDEVRPAGLYTHVWHPRNLASGTYFWRLCVDDTVQRGKVLLLK